jgi:hypothetical protein
MQTAVRFYRGCRGVQHGGKRGFSACQAMLLALMLSGCGGGGASSRPTASAPVVASAVQQGVARPARVAAPSPPLASGKSSPSVSAHTPTVGSRDDSVRLAELRKLALLSSLSERERAALLKQLPSATPSERLTLINGYAAIAVLPDRQKEVLLNQIEKIVAVSLPANQLVCNCDQDVQRKLCVKERCSNRSELQSICNRACGTLASFKVQCHDSQQCAGKE